MLKPPVDALASERALKQARLLALAIPAALLAGAYLSQYVGGLYPCEMCWWQRYAHMAALIPAVVVIGPSVIQRTSRRQVTFG